MAKAKKVAPKEIRPSSSGTKIAEALVKHFGSAKAAEIVKVMVGAATNKSMRRKLGRIQLALDSRKEAQ